MTDFSDQFRKIIMRYKRIGYNLNVMRQSACLVINPKSMFFFNGPGTKTSVVSSRSDEILLMLFGVECGTCMMMVLG